MLIKFSGIWVDHSNSPPFFSAFYDFIYDINFFRRCDTKNFFSKIPVANLLMEGHSVANENQIFTMLDFNPSISHLEKQQETWCLNYWKRQ